MFAETITNEEIDLLPQAVFQGDIVEITGRRALHEAVKYLSRHPFIGFDTETKPHFKAGEGASHTDLLQLSSDKKAFLIHLKQTGIPDYLAGLLADAEIKKIGAAVKDDIRGLQYYTRFEAGGFVDLQQMVALYGVKEKSVKKMSAIVLGLRVSKSQRLTNWAAEQLTEHQQQYAAVDAWVCYRIYEDLLRLDAKEVK